MALLSDICNTSKTHASITDFLYDIIDLTGLNLTVSHPNGTVEHVKCIGSYILENDLIIKDVLVVPGYHDLTQSYPIGTSSEKGGLYFLDEVFHKAKKTREPFPLSVHKTKRLGDLVHLDVWGPYRNDVAERKHRHLLNTARALMFQGGLPLNMWPESILTATYLINMLPTAVLSGKSPYDSLRSNDPYDDRGDSADNGNKSAPKGGVNSPNDSIVGDATKDQSHVQTKNTYTIDGNKSAPKDEKVTYENLSIDNLVFTTSLNKIHEPSTYAEAIKDSRWVEAMNQEIEALNRNKTWERFKQVLDIDNGICLTQRKYCTKLLNEFGMLACKPCSTPIKVNPDDKKVVAKYGDDVPLTGITNYQKLKGNLVSWKSKKQAVVSRSPTEAEYRAMCNVCCEVLWIRKMLADLQESRCYRYTLDVQRMSRDAIVVHEMFNGGVEMLSLYMRCSTDESRWKRTRLCLFQFFLRDQASNWLKCLPTGSISTWEDLTTISLLNSFHRKELPNSVMTSMFQQHQDESFSEAWTRFKDLLQKVPHHGIDLWLQVQIFYDHVNPATRRTIDQSTGAASLAHLLSETIPNTPKFLPFPTNPITFAIAAIGFVSHGEDVESHPHSQETWNEVTPVKRGNTHEAGKSSDPIFVLTGIPSTPHAATSYPPDAVEVLQKSFAELKEARARVKELFEEAKEENRKQYEECVDNEGRKGLQIQEKKNERNYVIMKATTPIRHSAGSFVL
ncbi:zinc finger, CCHC-type containing protein [Tanacetum coccineum]